MWFAKPSHTNSTQIVKKNPVLHVEAEVNVLWVVFPSQIYNTSTLDGVLDHVIQGALSFYLMTSYN